MLQMVLEHKTTGVRFRTQHETVPVHSDYTLIKVTSSSEEAIKLCGLWQLYVDFEGTPAVTNITIQFPWGTLPKGTAIKVFPELDAPAKRIRCSYNGKVEFDLVRGLEVL